MGTKANPGKYDCYANAEPDEPLFVLRSKDPSAEHLVSAWVALWAGDVDAAAFAIRGAMKAISESGKPKLPYQSEKSIEAQQCAKSMRTWRLGKQIERIEERLA